MAKSEVKNIDPESYKILRRKWGSMITRCTNPKNKNYVNYGARNITVCPEWRKFSNFFIWSLNNGFKPGLSIDRINPDEGYNPNNCRFITMKEQQQNKRSNRVFVDPFDGEKLCLAAIAKKYNVPEDTLRKRIDKYNIPLKEALTKLNGETKKWNIANDPFDGERLCITDLARKYNMLPITLVTRIRNGWSLEKAISIPVKSRRNHRNATI